MLFIKPATSTQHVFAAGLRSGARCLEKRCKEKSTSSFRSEGSSVFIPLLEEQVVFLQTCFNKQCGEMCNLDCSRCALDAGRDGRVPAFLPGTDLTTCVALLKSKAPSRPAHSKCAQDAHEPPARDLRSQVTRRRRVPRSNPRSGHRSRCASL